MPGDQDRADAVARSGKPGQPLARARETPVTAHKLHSHHQSGGLLVTRTCMGVVHGYPHPPHRGSSLEALNEIDN